MIRAILWFIPLILTGIALAGEVSDDRRKGLDFHAAWQADSAMKYLLKAYQKQKDDSVSIALAETCLWKKDFKTATNLLVSLVDPGLPDAIRVHGLLMEQAGRLKEALQDYDKAIPQLKKPWGTMERRAQVLAWLGDIPKAMEQEEQVASAPLASQGIRNRCNLHLGLWSAWKKDLDKAMVFVGKVLANDPKSVDALLLKGQLMEWKGEFRIAKETYGKVLVIDSSNGDARLRLGKLQWVE